MLNAMSDESSSWCAPPVSVTVTSSIGWPAMAPRAACSRTLSSHDRDGSDRAATRGPRSRRRAPCPVPWAPRAVGRGPRGCVRCGASRSFISLSAGRDSASLNVISGRLTAASTPNSRRRRSTAISRCRLLAAQDDVAVLGVGVRAQRRVFREQRLEAARHAFVIGRVARRQGQRDQRVGSCASPWHDSTRATPWIIDN